MANTAHSALTGSSLHEPKGVATATSGQAYIADGAGSGAWTTVTGLTFTGQIADWATPVAPSGWLECDGSTVSRTTYADLFTAMTVQQTGTKVSGSAVISSLSSTTNIKVGYYAGGTNITSGSTVLSVDSSTQVTISANATGSSTGTVVFSPWAQGNGTTTFTLPDVYTSGRFRRSRTSSVVMGTSQADQNAAHTHTGTTSAGSSHTHSFSATTSSDGDHAHVYNSPAIAGSQGGGGSNVGGTGNTLTAGAHTHTVSGTSGAEAAHTHTFTSASSGGTEARPLAMVFMTCIKT